MKILVTGSSGFIGSYLVQALVNEGHHVVGIDRDTPGWSQPHTFVHADILDHGVLDSTLNNVDCVFHLAASKDDWGISREEYFRDNVEATRKLIKAGSERQISRWFHYSTVGVLPRGSEPLDETAALDPETDYGASKARAEDLFRQLAESQPKASIIILRPSAVFGPRHPPTTNVHRLIETILADRFIMVGHGQVAKTTSYIENLTGATLFLLSQMEEGLRIFHYIDNPVMTTGQLVDTIYQALDKKPPDWQVPLGVAQALASVSDLLAAVSGVDLPITAARIKKFCTPTNFSGKAIRDLGFRQPVQNVRAVERTVEWHL